jgi:hypothetical protein
MIDTIQIQWESKPLHTLDSFFLHRYSWTTHMSSTRVIVFCHIAPANNSATGWNPCIVKSVCRPWCYHVNATRQRNLIPNHHARATHTPTVFGHQCSTVFLSGLPSHTSTTIVKCPDKIGFIRQQYRLPMLSSQFICWLVTNSKCACLWRGRGLGALLTHKPWYW